MRIATSGYALLAMTCVLSCLSRRFEHIFNEDPVAPGGVIDEDVGHRPHQSAVLDDGAAAHG